MASKSTLCLDGRARILPMRSAVRVSWLTCVLAAAGASALRAPVQPRSRALAMAWPGVGLSREAAPEVVEAESRKIADENIAPLAGSPTSLGLAWQGRRNRQAQAKF